MFRVWGDFRIFFSKTNCLKLQVSCRCCVIKIFVMGVGNTLQCGGFCAKNLVMFLFCF